MHLSRRFAAIVLTLGLSASLVGCGFHLRGSQIANLPEQYRVIDFDLSPEAQVLRQPLTIYLANFGATIDSAQPNVRLKIDNYELRRQLFSGKLTEVQLRLSASFSLYDSRGEMLTEPRTMIAQRSYQYDIASVNTERQEEKFLIQVMQEDLAQQIARQLHANRLPKPELDQAP